MNFVYAIKTNNRRGQTDIDLIDVTVTIGKSEMKAAPKTLRFSFSKAVKEKAFTKVDYLIPAIDTDNPSRIYFLAKNERGYKLCPGSGTGQRFYLVPSSLAMLIDKMEKYIGDYDLQYDPVCTMWFIDADKKLSL